MHGQWSVLFLAFGLNIAVNATLTDAGIMRREKPHHRASRGSPASPAHTAARAKVANSKKQAHVGASVKHAAAGRKRLVHNEQLVRNKAPKKARAVRKNMVRLTTHESTALKHDKAKLMAHEQRHVAKLMEKSAKLSAKSGSLPDDGVVVPISDGDKFAREFTIGFQVKFNHNAFDQNFQEIVSTDQHALLVQALGPSAGANKGKIAAWMKTDSGLGPNGRGVIGSAGLAPHDQGMLLSQTLVPNEWYDVQFRKTLDTLSLAVANADDPSNVHTESSTIDTSILFTDGDFDLEMKMDPSRNVTFGQMTATGDHRLLGELRLPMVVEGPPTSLSTTDVGGEGDY